VNWSGFIVFVVEDSQSPGVKLYWNSGRLNVSLRSSERDESWDVAGGDMLLDGHWHHYAASFDRQGEAVVYLDGKVVGRHDVSGLKGSLGSGKTLLLGKGDDPFQGLMDDVRLYHRVLKENEVAHLGGSGSRCPSWTLEVRRADRKHLCRCQRPRQCSARVHAGRW